MDSDSSSLSSAPPTDDERLAPIFQKFKGVKKGKNASSPATTVSPPRTKRSPSPPHEEVLADNFDIAFIVMFRSRFSSAFPPKLPHFGPQDIEKGVVDPLPTPQVEDLLCALLGIVLNRKKPVERGHHGRALEEAVLSQKPQWPRSWNGVNPLHGNRNFNTMSPVERLNLLQTLIIWSLSSSEIISQTIKDSYKQSRHEDDLNQPLSVQPWGIDGDKRKYWLIEGQDDTNFRLYREGNRALKTIPWWNKAGTIEEIKEQGIRLEKEGSQASRRLATRITSAIPRFEATEEKRKRREYRQFRRAQFVRPEPGFSMYEGRTRGKRMRYTFDDDLGDDSDEISGNRSTRQSNRSTPADVGPVVTASGRQVRARGGGMYGESLLSGQATNAATPNTNDFEGSETSEAPRNATRSGRLGGLNGTRKRKHIDGFNEVDQMSDEDDASESGNEWDGGDDDDVDDNVADQEDAEDDDEISEDDFDELGEPASYIVKLKIGRHPELANGNGLASTEQEDTKESTTALTSKEEPADVEMADANSINITATLPRVPKQELTISHPIMVEHSSSRISAPSPLATLKAEQAAVPPAPAPTPVLAPVPVSVPVPEPSAYQSQQQHPVMNGFGA